MFKIPPRSTYARNVITLMAGTSVAQAIPVAVSPLLTRIYTPEQFGLFALFLAIVSIAGVLVTGRYEQAILLPRQDRDAIHIVVVSVLLSIGLSMILLTIVVVFNASIVSFFNNESLEPWLYWVPLSTMLTGIYQSLNYWSNRKSQYKRLAISRTLQSGCTSGGQLAVGSGTAGLVWGQLAGQLVSTLVLLRAIWLEDRKFFYTINRKRTFVLAKKYINFPKFLIVAHGFNTASSQMPVMLLGAFFNASTAGFFSLTQRVLGAPITLVSGALGDVFRQEASYAYVHNGNCRDIYIRTLRRLILISVIPFILFFLVAPDLFSWLFSDNWRVAGYYAQILTPMFFFRFVVSPLSSVFMMAEAQKLDLIWQILLFTMVVAALFVGYLIGEARLSLMLFSGAYSICFVVNLFISYQLACGISKKGLKSR